MKRQRGFTLIEVMIVAVVVGILAAIALPSYKEHIAKTRRTTAQAALMDLAQHMQRLYTHHNAYCPDGSCPALPFDEAPTDAGDKYYDLSISGTDTAYTLRATPKNAQAGDGFLELTHTGQRRWDANRNGSISADELRW